MITILLSHCRWRIIHFSAIGRVALRCPQLCDRDVIAITSFASTSKAPALHQRGNAKPYQIVSRRINTMGFIMIHRDSSEILREKRRCYIMAYCSLRLERSRVRLFFLSRAGHRTTSQSGPTLSPFRVNGKPFRCIWFLSPYQIIRQRWILSENRRKDILRHNNRRINVFLVLTGRCTFYK